MNWVFLVDEYAAFNPQLNLRFDKLTSCTWKYGCQNHNYVQGVTTAQY
ncbi:MAG: hypothetical protein V7L25_13000 [Nostoc sp.]